MLFYRIYVRLRNGGQATGRELHDEPPPDHIVLNVPLITGHTVKARIDHSHGRGTRSGLVSEVYADEI